jgi:Acetylornithine deacetylase/Succinyl-diaminopimelate desuccinylase and related deacylases
MLAPFRDRVIELLQSLVSTNSVATPPNGLETNAQRVLQEFLRRHDVDAEIYEVAFLEKAEHPYIRRDRQYSGRHNLIARVEGTGGGRSLMLSGHIDTVPVGNDGWTDNPWSGVLRDGRVYGRGSYDMKGGLVAAFATIVALCKSGLRLRGNLLCESVIDEEWGGGGGTLAGRLRGDIADACIISEPTDLAIFRASRGGYIVDIEIHASDADNFFSRDEVISPALPLARLLGWIEEWVDRRRKIAIAEVYSGFTDPAPVQVLALEAGSFDPQLPLTVPLKARVKVYFQFLPGEEVSTVIDDIKSSFSAFCKSDRFFSSNPPKWKELLDPPLLGHELAADHELTLALSRGASLIMDKPALVTGAGYPCDAFLNQQYFGMPTLIFGPCGAAAHNANEYVDVGSVLQTAEILLATALEWCN